jgi:capsular polysaccharide biosynthesis protein
LLLPLAVSQYRKTLGKMLAQQLNSELTEDRQHARLYDRLRSETVYESVTTTNGTKTSAAFSRVSEDEGPFSLSDLTQIVLKRLWVIFLVVFVVVGAAVGASFWQTPTYEASTEVWVDQQLGNQGKNLAGNVEGLQSLMPTMIHAIDSRPVADKAIRNEAIRSLGLEMSPEELLNNLTIEQVEGTNFISLTYEGTSAAEATQIVNTMAEVSSERISTTTKAAGSNLTATPYVKAKVPDNPTPVSPDPLRNGLLAAVFGLMLGIGLALLMEYLDHSWRSPEEVEQASGVPTFATIPDFSLAKSKRNKRTLA